MLLLTVNNDVEEGATNRDSVGVVAVVDGSGGLSIESFGGPYFLSCSCCLRRATCWAITCCRSAVNLHGSQVQFA